MSTIRKICLVGHECGYYKGQGGIATYIEQTAIGFSKLGLDVHIIYINGSDVDHQNITCWKIKENNSVYKNSESIDRILDVIKPDIVECTDFLGLISFTLMKRARYGQLDYVCKFINNHHTGIREVWEWGTELEFFTCSPDWMREVYQYERCQALLNDANFSTSKFLANYLSKQYKSDFNCCPSYYEIENKSIPLSPILESQSSTSLLKILSLGRFELRKKQELLIKSCCELLTEGYSIHVTLIGNSGSHFCNKRDYMEYCYSLIPINFKNNFSFFDFIPYKDIQNRYSLYDLFIVPSPYENFPNTALEAISHGVIVSGSMSSGIADMIGDTKDTLCFEKNSVSSMKKIISNFINTDEFERNQIKNIQYKALKEIVSYDSTIKNRISNYDKIEERKFPKETNVEQCLFITTLNDGTLNNIKFRNKTYSVDSKNLLSLISSINYLILLPEVNLNKFSVENNYFPSKGVISASSNDLPYGTIDDLKSGKKRFSQLIANLDEKTIESIGDLNLIKLFAKVINISEDIIFFKDDNKKVEHGFCDDIKYEIDLLRFKFNG